MTEIKGLIPEFADLITKHIPTPKEWATNIATAILSIAVGADKVVRSDIGPLHMNLWFLMVGPSGLAHKTTPLNYFAFPVLTKLTENIQHPTILPKDYSIEGFIEYLSKYCSQGGIVRDEFTTIFKQSRMDYLGSNLEFLSELYDGTMQKRFTRKTKLEQATKVYVVFLSATTPYLYTIMKPTFFIQGTGNRILYTNYDLLEDVEDVDVDDEEAFNKWLDGITKRAYSKRNDKISDFAEHLAGVHNSNVKYLTLEPDTSRIYLRYRKEKRQEAKQLYKNDKFNMLGSYVVRLPEFALKLSGLARISSFWKTLGETQLDELAIMEEDMKWAINKTNRHLEHFKVMLEDWRKKGRTKPYRTDEDIKDEVVKLLKENGGRMPWSNLCRELGIYGRKFQDLMDWLCVARIIGWRVIVNEEDQRRNYREVHLRKNNH